MYYLIDGYNRIFSMIESKDSLQTLRVKIIAALQKRFTVKKIHGMLVFDGAHRRDEESGLTYSSPLIIAYAPKGQTADEYIVQQIQLAKNSKLITVITNDKGLARHAKYEEENGQGNRAFIK